MSDIGPKVNTPGEWVPTLEGGMARQPVALRLEAGVLEWADEYASERGVSRQAVLEAAVASFMEDVRSGVPELRRAAAEQSSLDTGSGRGFGQCPDRPEGLGHVWGSAKVHEGETPCSFCGLSGREHLKTATRARARLFSELRTPESIKAWGKKSDA